MSRDYRGQGHVTHIKTNKVSGTPFVIQGGNPMFIPTIGIRSGIANRQKVVPAAPQPKVASNVTANTAAKLPQKLL